MDNEGRKKLLISEIKSGNCVAFIGAGFSAPAVHTWTELIDKLAQNTELTDGVKDQVNMILGHDSKASNPLFDREAAAELIEDDLKNKGINHFRKEVRKALFKDGIEGNTEVTDRIELLNSIPFDSVLTTNFDSKISRGKAFHKADLEDLLRNRKRGWSDGFDIAGKPKPSPVITLHGDIEDDSDDAQSLVFSRSGYRKLLFETSNYQSLIRAVFATKTVVFFGFSFSDAYLNLIRSEVISMLMPHGKKHVPFAYAVMDDISEAQVDYLAKHEGISAIRYCKKDENDHSGFTEILRDISNGTKPSNVARGLIKGKKIVWFDPNPKNNLPGIEELKKSMPVENIILETELEEARNQLKSGHVDLLITHWGHNLHENSDGIREPNALSLLKTIRTKNLPIPTLVFATEPFAPTNRAAAVKQGAFDYIYEFPDLYRRIEDLFKT